MPHLIFSPRFVLQEMLKLPFNRVQVNHLQKITGKSEKTIYNWFSRGEMAKTSEYRTLMENLSKSENFFCCPINSREFIRVIKDPGWGDFSSLWLQKEDNAFFLTMRTMLHNLYKNRTAGANDLDFNRLGSCLPLEVIKGLKNNLAKRRIPKERLDDFVEVIAFIFFLALLESEYCKETNMDHLFVEKLLPRYINRDKGQVSTPTELFFKGLLEGLIEKSLFKDKADLAREIEHWTGLKNLEDAQRVMDRYSNSGMAPKWETFNEWVKMFATQLLMQQEKKDGVKKNKDEWEAREKTEVIHLQNLFGGARLLDKAFRLSEKMLAQGGLDPVDFFRKEYGACAERLKKRGG